MNKKDLHAHFDCFSGAAGDMMLASCLDASPNPKQLLEQIESDLKNGIPEIRDEFSLQVEKVWRGGMGSIAALKLSVGSVYNHEAAPVPKEAHMDKVEMEADEAHGHSHEHSNNHDRSHEHSNNHEHSHEHSNNHEHSHGHSNNHEHLHEHSNNHEHSHHDSHNHSHEHGHGHRSKPLRNLPQIRAMLQQAANNFISKRVSELAIQVFTELAIAESFTHGTNSEDTVHFHEVGAIDSIVDVIGTLIALEYLSVSTVSCSRIPMGEGTVWTDHGQLPVPAFATMRLLIGMKTCKGPGDMNGTITGELVTPTAAALLRVLTGVADHENAKRKKDEGKIISSHQAVRVGRAPSFTPTAVGLGAGTKDFIKHPNVIRLIIGDEVSFDDGRKKSLDPGIPLIRNDRNPEKQMTFRNYEQNEIDNLGVDDCDEKRSINTHELLSNSDEVQNESSWKIDNLTLIQANIDDITSELLSYVMDLLLKNGAIDVWVEPIVMKKGRSAHQLNCLCHSSSDNDAVGKNTSTFSCLMEIIFRQSTTLGIRIQRNIERAALKRKIIQVQTIFGVDDVDARNGFVDVKLGYLSGEIVSMKAEFDHCQIISEKSGVPIKLIADNATKIAASQNANGTRVPS